MIKPILQWLDLHPGSYWLIAVAGTLPLLARIAAAVRRETRHPAERSSASWVDAGILLLFLLAWRWPFLLVADEFNPDESQLIAGAITLARDPVFWRAVDGTTSGPLNFYALLPFHWLGLPLDYFTARLAGLLLAAGALFAALRASAHHQGRAPAWLGVLPGAAFFATATHPDLVHYSSEHVPLLLVAVPFWLLATRAPADRARLWAALFIAGAAPWAKLQTAPLALVLIAWATWPIMRAAGIPLRTRWARVGVAALWALGPTLLCILLAAAGGQLENAFRRYFAHNLFYVSQGTGGTALEAFGKMAGVAWRDGQLPLLLGSSLAIVLGLAGYFAIRRIRPSAPYVAGGCLALAAVVAVAAPRREYVHYLLLLPVPFTLWGAAAAGEGWSRLQSRRARHLLAAGLVVAGGLLPLGLRSFQPVPQIYGDFLYHWQHPRTSVSVVVGALARPGDSLAVWGWANRLYVETGLPQATRDAHSTWSIFDNAQRDYHRAAYLEDLRRHRPAVFVDAVGPGAFVFNDRRAQAHENFPELADQVRQHYVFVADLVEARVYARRDLANAVPISPDELDRLVSQGRLASRAIPIVPPVVPLAQYTQKIIDRRNVVMLLPPARIEWALDAGVRQVTLEFGIDPVAYLQGTTNGAEIILEVVSSSRQARPVYQRLVDPIREAGDRQPRTVTVTLPPFDPDSRLVLRTTAGPGGDAAWDWLYLAALRLHRHPTYLPEQFPGFGALPVAADPVTPGTVDGDPGPQLLMHAPASITFALNGQARLQFGYGFQPGAYTDGGNTDGAILRVSLQQIGQADRVLFERLLDPVRVPGDRGPQQLDLALPADPKDARLRIQFSPGPAGNAAWDWTYLGHLTLR